MNFIQKILVVDDHEDIRDLFRRVLTGVGYRVITAPDGPTALNLCAAQYFDLAVLDIMMPGMDGFELARAIRKDHTTPIVIASARAEHECIDHASACGAVGYLVKPIDNNQLIASVGTAVQTLSKRSSEILYDKRLHGILNLAKGITMERRKMTESHAHQWMVTESRELRLRIHDFARRIVTHHELALVNDFMREKRGCDYG